MLPYISLLVLVFHSIIYDRTKYQKIAFFSLSFVLLIFCALRVGGTGLGDYDAYLRLYTKVIDWDDIIDPTIHAELGFRILAYFGNANGFESQFIISSMAILSIIPILWSINKYSCYPMGSLLFWMPYFLTMNMHASRVSVAAGFGLVFMISFYKKTGLLSLLFFLLAFAFHSSAICLLLVFFTRFSFRTLLSFIVFAILLGLIINPLFFIADIFTFLGAEKIAWLIRAYLSSEDYGYPMKMYDPRIFLSLITVFLIYNIRKTIRHSFDIYIFKIFLVGVLLIICFSSVTIIAWRISYFYLVSCVLVIPLVCKYYNFRFVNSIGPIRIMSLCYSVLYVLYALPIILGAQPYELYIG